MKVIYRLVLEFKTLHPLRFWATTFITLLIIIVILWILSKKRIVKVDSIDYANTGTEEIAKIEIDKQGLKAPKEINALASKPKPQTKIYINKSCNDKSEPTEPNLVQTNPTKTAAKAIVKNEIDTQEAEIKKENTPLKAKPNAKVHKDKLRKNGEKINEINSAPLKSTTPTQKNISPKVEVFDGKAKPKSKEQLPKAKEETKKSNDEVVFVNFEISKAQTKDAYPVLRVPTRGTVIRSYRLGNTKRRGFKENSFQKSIEHLFGKEFKVLGDARLNTGKETRPFEPDIALIDKSQITNLRIDIEIDEPYAGITRQPTHCKGEDANRDTYFVGRGWIVIRFSEYQVHLQEKNCLRFIAETIKSAISTYNIPDELANQTPLQTQQLWDIVQAQKWEKAKYREQYLNHIFQNLEEQPETMERDFDEQELKEEKLVQPTIIGKADIKESLAFNLINAHTRDCRVQFYPEPHTYTIDNTPAPSASTVIAKFFPEFDSVYWANRKAPELGMTPFEVELMWKNKGTAAAKDGTILHEQIENFYLEKVYKKTNEFHLFENFANEHKHMKPYRTEWRIFDEHNHIAGTIDLISKIGDEYEMYDWKRSKKIVNSLTGEPIKNNQRQSGIGYLSDIDDTSYNRYCLQQSLYKYILEKNYGLKVSRMYLIVLYPDYDRYYKVEVPYLRDKVEYILQTL